MAKKTAKKVKPTKGEFLFNPAEFGLSLDELIKKKGWCLSAKRNYLVYVPGYEGSRLPRQKSQKRQAKEENRPDLFPKS